jgi:beta-1,4-mannosyltransferase
VQIVARPAFRNRHRNPYNWLLYTHLRELGVEVHEFADLDHLTSDHAILHLHWPEARLNAGPAHAALRQMLAQDRAISKARRLGIRIVWTVHNLRSHEQAHPWLERLFWRRFIPQLDAYISPSDAGRQAALERHARLARVPGFVIPIGHYRGVYPNAIDRAEARARLGIPAHVTVLGFVGLIRSYKNVPRLLSTFRRLPDPHIRLVIAGKPEWPETESRLRAAAGADPRVRLDLGYVPDDELQLYLNSADLVVLPFREILNSASALLALSYDRPVLVPDLGAMAELQASIGDHWVRTYGGDLTTASLVDAVRWVRSRPAMPRPHLEPLSWSRVAEATAEAYRMICA